MCGSNPTSTTLTNLQKHQPQEKTRRITAGLFLCLPVCIVYLIRKHVSLICVRLTGIDGGSGLGDLPERAAAAHRAGEREPAAGPRGEHGQGGTGAAVYRPGFAERSVAAATGLDP